VELGLGKRELETRLQELKKEHERKTLELEEGYDVVIKEMSEDTLLSISIRTLNKIIKLILEILEKIKIKNNLNEQQK